MRDLALVGSAVCVVGLLCSVSLAEDTTITIDFEGPPAGTVVAGALPGGGMAPGDVFFFTTFSVANLGGGPSSLLIFDSTNPSGEDEDLGTPNETFGGPGVGAGGEVGTDGENAVEQGNLLIIAEDIVDSAPEDGIVDDPDDEAGGGIITIVFEELVTVESLTILDIDDASPTFVRLFEGPFEILEVPIFNLGNNSVQTVDLSSVTNIDNMEVRLGGSGAIDDLVFTYCSITPVEDSSWGAIKSLYR